MAIEIRKLRNGLTYVRRQQGVTEQVARKHQHRFHGDPDRYQAVANFIASRFGKPVENIADVAGGQGMLSRILLKRHNCESEVVDPKRWTPQEGPNQAVELDRLSASYYDLFACMHTK